MKSNTKKYGTDLLILGLSALAAYGILGVFYILLNFDIGALPILVQTLIGALFAFGLMGLGAVVICARSKESFLSFGLKKENLILTVVLSALVCLPCFAFWLFTNRNLSYFPLQNLTEFILIYGMLVVHHYTGNAWGCVLIFLFFWSGMGY